MAKSPRSKPRSSYKVFGATYDGVQVLAPKMKPVRFTVAEVRRAIREVLAEGGQKIGGKNLRNEGLDLLG